MKTIIKSALLAASLAFGGILHAQCPNDIGCFTSIVPTAQTNQLIIAKEHRFQLIFKEGDLYTNPLGAITTVPGNNDFTAYIPMNGSSELGHLCVNHENNPGGISVVDLHFNRATQLWEVDTTRPVDLYNGDLVTTTRNCAGGITPWGTMISSEETFNSGDANSDGYQDVGWLFEVNPLTAKVVDYENDGVQDKLWAHGRAARENAAVAKDSITVYSGEDGGSSAIFKFVADTPGDLSSGKLYALKLDSGLVNGEPVVPTGSWVLVPNTSQGDRNNARGGAQLAGATNFNGVEECEIGTIDGKIYFTSKNNDRVYRFQDNGATISGFETFVGGMSYDIHTDMGTFTEPWADGNDNLAFDDKGNLWVLQDGGRNYVWVVRPDHTQADPKVDLWASFPEGSEPTGLTFSPDYRFGFISVQHPDTTNAPQMDASGNMVRFNASASFVFALAGNLGEDSLLVSNEGWQKSRVVTPTNYSGYWSGVNGMLPADSSYTDSAEVGQPYGYPSIYEVEGSKVIKTGNNITYFRKKFNINSTDWDVRLRTTVDDQAEVYINGHRIAMIGTFGRMNYKSPGHDAVLYHNGSAVNGFAGGDAYGYLTGASMDTILTDSTNEVVIAVRNLGKPSDKGGFSFRMDLSKKGFAAPVIPKSALTNRVAAIGVYPNPTQGELVINIPQNYAVSKSEVMLYDMNGRLLRNEFTASSQLAMDLSELPGGVYLLKIICGDTLSTQKIFKR